MNAFTTLDWTGLAIADRGYLLENGRVAGTGEARALMDDPAVQRAYLGL